MYHIAQLIYMLHTLQHTHICIHHENSPDQDLQPSRIGFSTNTIHIFHDGANLSMIMKMVDSERPLSSLLASTGDFTSLIEAVLPSCSCSWGETSLVIVFLNKKDFFTCILSFNFVSSLMHAFTTCNIFGRIWNICSLSMLLLFRTLILKNKKGDHCVNMYVHIYLVTDETEDEDEWRVRRSVCSKNRQLDKTGILF